MNLTTDSKKKSKHFTKFHHHFCGKVFPMLKVGLLWLDSKQLHDFDFQHQILYKNGSISK